MFWSRLCKPLDFEPKYDFYEKPEYKRSDAPKANIAFRTCREIILAEL